MPINEAQLASLITAALNYESDNPNIDPAQARVRIGEKFAAAVSEFTIGRETQVTGTSQSGGNIYGTGVIQE